MSNVTNNPAIQRMNELLDEHSFVELGALVKYSKLDRMKNTCYGVL